jgi:hypothetical protein
MSNPKRRPDSQLHGLKWLLTAGSLAAALLGARLLAANEPTGTAAAPAPAAESEITIVPVQPRLRTLGQSNGVQIGSANTIQLAPVPRAISPSVRPIARSRSSR